MKEKTTKRVRIEGKLGNAAKYIKFSHQTVALPPKAPIFLQSEGEMPTRYASVWAKGSSQGNGAIGL